MNPFPEFLNKIFKSPHSRSFSTQGHQTSVTLVDQIDKYIPLLELQDSRQLLQVQVIGNNHPQTYLSMVLGVDFVEKKLLLDAFAYLNDYNPIIIGDEIIVTHQQHGQLLSFKGKILAIFYDADNLVYSIDLPSDISYKQRRFYPRLTTSHNSRFHNRFSVKLKSPRKTNWQCTLQNISAGGIRVSVPGNVLPHLQVGKTLPAADIRMEDKTFSCRLKIKSFQHKRRPYENTVISLAFSDLHYQDRIRLQTTIAGMMKEGQSGDRLAVN